MPRKTVKRVGRPRRTTSTPPIAPSIHSPNLGERILSSKPATVSVAAGAVILLLLAFPFRFLIVPAIVNGQPIFSWTYVTELHKRNGEQVLTELINKKLIEQEIAKQNIQVTQTDIDGQIKQIEDRIGTESGGLDAMLSLQGMKRPDLIEQIRLNLQLEKLVKGTITISDEDIKKELTENQESYKDLSEVDAATTAAENLRQLKMNSAFTEWFQAIRQTAKIKNYFASPAIPLPHSSV